MKAPVTSILEFATSNKAILVEGPSEYMLFEKFYESVVGNRPEESGVHIIDVRGLSLKRYLDISKLINCKVAVISDNDGNVQKCCIDKYSNFVESINIKICYERDE